MGTEEQRSKTHRPGRRPGGALSVLEGLDEWGLFEGDFDYKWLGDPKGNVTAVVVKPTYTITMPYWAAVAKQPPACKKEWERMCACLRKHEDGHRDIFVKGIADLEKQLKCMKSATGAEIDDLMEKTKTDIQSKHDSFDASTRHGQSQGVSLTILDACRAKGS